MSKATRSPPCLPVPSSFSYKTTLVKIPMPLTPCSGRRSPGCSLHSIYRYLMLTSDISGGLSRWLRGEESTCQCKGGGFNPWVRKIPWRRKWQFTPVLLPGKSHGQRSLVGCSPWGHKELDTTERLHFLSKIKSVK